jgi:hypothetical protein
MPTPMRAFYNVAKRYIKVDPDNYGRITHFFGSVLPTLGPEIISKVYEELLGLCGTKMENLPIKRTYETDVEIPKLSESPEITLKDFKK